MKEDITMENNTKNLMKLIEEKEGLQDNLIRFTERLTKEAHPRLLSVTWFGGEPLMACEVI